MKPRSASNGWWSPRFDRLQGHDLKSIRQARVRQANESRADGSTRRRNDVVSRELNRSAGCVDRSSCAGYADFLKDTACNVPMTIYEVVLAALHG